MNTWPAIKNPSLPISESFADPVLRTKGDNNITYTRARNQRMIGTYSLTWPSLSQAHYLLLSAFYGQQAGGSMAFQWGSKVVRFADPIAAEIVAWAADGTPKYWQVSVTLEEV